MKSLPDKAFDVFISYSSADKVIADAACAVLERNKIRCWIAPRNVVPGKEWGEEIVNAISTSHVMLLVFSKQANDAPQVRREVERAIGKGLAVLPFRIEDVLPTGAMEFALNNNHWLDAFTPPIEQHLEKLARSIQMLLAQSETHRPEVSIPQPDKRTIQHEHPRKPTAPTGRRWKLAIALAVAIGCLMFGAFAMFRPSPEPNPVPVITPTISITKETRVEVESWLGKSVTTSKTLYELRVNKLDGKDGGRADDFAKAVAAAKAWLDKPEGPAPTLPSPEITKADVEGALIRSHGWAFGQFHQHQNSGKVVIDFRVAPVFDTMLLKYIKGDFTLVNKTGDKKTIQVKHSEIGKFQVLADLITRRGNLAEHSKVTLPNDQGRGPDSAYAWRNAIVGVPGAYEIELIHPNRDIKGFNVSLRDVFNQFYDTVLPAESEYVLQFKDVWGNEHEVALGDPKKASGLKEADALYRPELQKK